MPHGWHGRSGDPRLLVRLVLGASSIRGGQGFGAFALAWSPPEVTALQ